MVDKSYSTLSTQFAYYYYLCLKSLLSFSLSLFLSTLFCRIRKRITHFYSISVFFTVSVFCLVLLSVPSTLSTYPFSDSRVQISAFRINANLSFSIFIFSNAKFSAFMHNLFYYRPVNYEQYHKIIMLLCIQ